MFKYTRHSLKKVEALFEELEYEIRYEKGSFNAGYCILETKKVVVINKFYDTEGRLNCLIDILSDIDTTNVSLSDKSAKLYKQLKGMKTEEEE